MEATATDGRNAEISREQVRRFRAREVDRDFAYLSSDGKHVTTWTGDVLGDVIATKIARVGFPDCSGRRPERYFITFRGIDGRTWRGTGPGACMYLRCRVSASQ